MKATVPISASTARSTLRPKKELQLKNSSSRPEPSRPITAPAPTTPTQTPTAWALSSGGNDVVMIDSVVGITSAAPTPIAARSPISVVGSFATSAAAAAAAEDHEPDHEDDLAPEAVADRAGDQQQAGEDHRVRVHDPLELALRGAGVTSQIGQRHVQAAHRRDDHHESKGHDSEYDLAPPGGEGVGLVGHDFLRVEFSACRILHTLN